MVLSLALLLNFLNSFCLEIPYNDYFEYFSPDYGLDVPATNMANLNTRAYLEKCT